MRQVNILWRNKWARHGVLPLVFFTVVTLILTYPVVARLGTHAAGAPYGDSFEAVRLIWWTGEAISQGMHPASQPLLVYPDGFFSPVEWAAPMAHLAGLPFDIAFPPLVAYNLTFLGSYVLTGLAGYLLGWELTHLDPAALLAGLVIMVYPTRVGHATAGHLTLLTNYWLVLYGWSLVRLWRGGGIRVGILAGLFIVFTAGAYPTNLAYEVIPMSVVVGGVMAWRLRRQWLGWWRSVLALGGTAIVGVLIAYGPLLQGYLQGSIDNLRDVGMVRYSADLLGAITPSPFNPVLSKLGLIPGWAWDVLGDNTIEAMAYTGVTVSLLAVIALWRNRQDALPWALAALAGYALALGPVLKIADRVVTLPVEGGIGTQVPLPYALYTLLPGLGMGRTPGRLNMVTGVALAALTALGCRVVLDQFPRLRQLSWGSAALLGLVVVIGIEYQLFPEFPTTEAPQPAYFMQLADDAEQGIVRPVLNLPANDFFVTRWLLYYQTAHHQPVLTGHVVRSTPANPAMMALANAAALPPVADGFLPALSPAEQTALLRATGAKVVVVHRRFGDGEAMAVYLPEVLGAPVYEDAQVTIFEVPDGPLPDAVLMTAGGGWDGPQPDSRWVSDALTLSAYIPQEQTGRWQFGAASWLLDRWFVVESEEGMMPDRMWLVAASDADWATASRTLAAGFQQFDMTVEPEPDGCTHLPDEPDCRRVLVRAPRWAATDEMGGVYLDEVMRFAGVESLPAEAGMYSLRLFWQAVGTERGDYTLFVHLLDADGQSVAQWDGPPAGAEMPTSQWPAGGTVPVDVTLDVSDLPPGTYQLYAGLYTYPDLARLPVNSDGPRAQDGLLYLDDFVVPPPAVR